MNLGLRGRGKGSVAPLAATPANPEPMPGRSAEKPDKACHTHAPLRTGAERGDCANTRLRTEKPDHRGETDLWCGLQRGSSKKTQEAGPRPRALRHLAHEASRTDRASHREGFPRPLEGMQTGPLTEAGLLGGEGVRMFWNERGSHLTTPDVLNTTELFP